MRTQQNILQRRLLFLLIFLLLLILVIVSFKFRPSGPVVEAPSPVVPVGVPAERVLSLPLLSASATAPGSRLVNLFDQNADTYWLLPPGSGPGECLEINFLPQNMPFLSGLRVVPGRSDSLAGVKKIALYVNHELAEVKEGIFDFPIAQKVFALRLCIESTQADEVYSYTDGEQLVSIHTLPNDRQTGLQSVLFFDREGQAYYPLAPRYVAANVVPSSNLNPVSAFHAGRLFDGQPSSAWIEGEASTQLAGSSIRIQLAEAIHPSAIALWNGYQLSDLHFQNNSRVAALTITQSGIPLVSLDCGDQAGGQLIDLPGDLRLQEFSIDIKRSYPGLRYPETAISEWCFLEGPRPIVLQTNWPEVVRRELEQQIGQTPLRVYLNRPFTNRIEHRSGAYYSVNRICIREDGSFYAQTEHHQLQGKRRTQNDVSGHWEIQEADGQRTRLRLFGTVERLGFTANATPTIEEALFTEIVDVFADRIEGGAVLGRFYLR